mgnify:CR=1 FL=1
MRAITAARTALIVLGIGLLGVGALALISEVPASRFPGIAVLRRRRSTSERRTASTGR